jgi:hypothetical protein
MFVKLKHTFIAVAFGLVAVNAAGVVAVLEITTPSGADANLSISEYRHLTDELRTKARETLPSGYSILTRDNIIQLLPPDEKEAECLAEGCAVDIGRAIGAEYVTQGFVGMFEGMLTLTVELYESMSGNMLGSFVTESDNARGLLGTIREKAPAMFAKIAEKNKGGAPAANAPSTSATVPPSIPSNVPPSEPKKGNASLWVAIGLDVLGVAAIGLGVYNNKKVSDSHKDSEKFAEEARHIQSGQQRDEKEKGFKDAKEKMKSAETTRNIFYATGGALLLGGIAVHIWF